MKQKAMKELSEEQMNAINPGIRFTVRRLREWGFNTCDSGDGETHDFECDRPYPYVNIQIEHAIDLCGEADRLLELLESAGVNFDDRPHPQDDPEGWERYPSIEASYSPVDGCPFIHLANVVLKP